MASSSPRPCSTRAKSRRRMTPNLQRLAASALLLCVLAACPESTAAAATPNPSQALPSANAPAGEGVQAVLAAAAPPAASPPPAPAPKFSLIIVFRDASTLARLRMMCNTSPLLYRLFSRALRLPLECHMPGACRRIYSETISGFAGDFSDADLSRLERCLPPSSVFYKEPDATVFKAEDSTYWHPPDSPEEEQATQQRQRRQAQQQEGQGGRRLGRRMQQQALLMPRVEAFEERTLTPVSVSGPINMAAISGGLNLSDPAPKTQTVDGQLWNLDRMDQRDLPLDSKYIYGAAGVAGTGKGTTIYVVDSGVRLTHQEFKTQDGSRSRASYGYDFVEDDYVADDCDGHGTHVSGSAIGLQVGVAKEAEVVAVRILDCTGSGTISDTVAALDWVAANHRKPAVVTLSLGIQVGSWSRVLEDAVRSLTNTHGVTVVVASGNSGVDACYVAPANVPEVISVSASNLASKGNGSKAGDAEDMYKWSNSGPCIDLWAPGVDIFSACGGPSRCETVTDSSYTYASGTSMAVPQLAGVAAAYLSAKPDALPRDVSAALISTATLDKIVSTRFKPGTPNRLLYSRLGAPTVVAAASGP